MTAEEPRITPTIAAQCGFCPSGMRQWCKANDFDLVRFIREGVPVSEVEHMDDEYVQRMVRMARGEEI